MAIFRLLGFMDLINWMNFLSGSIIMISVYALTIMINIRITQGEFGITQGRFKAYCIAAFFGVACNASELLIYKLNINDNEWLYIIEVIGLFYVPFKLWRLKNSGDPGWYVEDEDNANEDPFSATIGVSFCIMIAYTFPWWAAALFGMEVTMMQGLCELEHYKYKRVFPLIIINSTEIILASFIVKKVYEFDYFKALFIIAIVGLVFNILLVAINGIILDYITKDKYRQK